MKFIPSLLSLSLAALVVGGCAQRPPTTGDSTSGSGARTADGGAVLPEFNPPYPGPYQTVTIGEAEFRQGRYLPGKPGGTLVRSLIGSDPKTFNYWAATDASSRELSGHMLAGLVSTDSYTGDVIPDLAESVTRDPDNVTYTIKLRKGLKWSDGKPITAHDVAFTWNEIIKRGYGNSSLRDVTQIDGKSPEVIVVDELTNKFITPKPFAPFEQLLGIAIAPKHVFEPIIKGKDGHKKFAEAWSQSVNPKTLVTSGPFRLSRFVPGQRVEFERAENYYAVDKEGKRLPYLERIVYQFVPDVNTNLLKFKAGEIDISGIRPRDTVELISLQDKGNFKLYRLGPGEGSNFIMFNLNRRSNPKTGKPYVNPVKSEWFNDRNFRQAVNYTLNRDNIVANYFRGLGYPAFTAEAPNSPWFNSSLKPFKQDINKAMQLLEQSGFQKRADGFLYDKNGNRVEFDLVAAAASPFYESTANLFQTDMKKLGIKVNIQLVEFNALLDRVDNQKNWEAGIFSLTGNPLEPHSGANIWRSDGRLHLFDMRFEPGQSTVIVTDARPWEKELDRIYNEGAQIFDKKERKKYYDRAQEIIYEEAPFIYIATPMSVVGARNTLGNFEPTPLSQQGNGLHNLDEIYKKDAQNK